MEEILKMMKEAEEKGTTMIMIVEEVDRYHAQIYATEEGQKRLEMLICAIYAAEDEVENIARDHGIKDIDEFRAGVMQGMVDFLEKREGNDAEFKS